MKVCWNITSKCNRKCKYCFKFDREDLSLEKNKKILEELHKMGVMKITWSGGEPFLYKNLQVLLKQAKELGISNFVNTNLTTITLDNLYEKIQFLDRLIISLDFIKDDLNEKYGIGKNYCRHVFSVLEKIKKIKPNIEIQLNTVLFSGNVHRVDELYEAISEFNIDCWKIIRFLPIRGCAYQKEKELSITSEQFNKVKEKYTNKNSNFDIVIHGFSEMNERHIIVLSSGELVFSEKEKDKKVTSLI